MPDQEERETAEIPFAGRTLHMYRPTDGQLLVVIQVTDIADEEDVTQQVQMVTNLGVVIRTMFADEADRQEVHRGLASGKYELEDYFELAKNILLEWAPDQVANREERRAAAKKAPAKKAVRRPARR
jgi:hypothetical protein